MPTGYTAALYDGEQSFPDYAMSCARAFGALVTMRDEPADAEIPDEFVPSDYHVRELAKHEQALAEAQAWTDAEAEAHAQAENERAAQAHREHVAERAALRSRYETMLAEVDLWVAPTEDHAEFKEFMRDQLVKAIDFDCGYEREAPKPFSGAYYRDSRIKSAKWSIDYHKREAAAEVERAEQRTAWVRALRESLKVTA